VELDLKITRARIVRPSGIVEAGIGIKDGRIAIVGLDELLPAATETIDAAGRYVIPGVVDPEAHPGHTDPMTLDSETETKAAAVSGVTTWGIQSPSSRFGQPTYSFDGDPADCVSFHEVFELGRDAFEKNSCIDFFFTFQMESDQQASEIPEYARQYGVTSFKYYGQWRRVELDHWGMAAANGIVRGWDDGTFYLALEKTAEIGPPGIVSFHPENWEIARVFEERLRRAGREDIGAWDDRSPDFVEAIHLRNLTYLARIVGCPVYAQHCTNIQSIEAVRRARDEGVKLYVQTGPPWLYFNRDDWKIMPPLRRREHTEALWEALSDGTIDAVGSDHVVSRLRRSELGDQSVWSPHGTAFASRVEMLLPIMLHEGVNNGRITLERMVQVMCENPARIFGLYPRKGTIQIGADADLAIVDLEREITVRDEMIYSRPGWTLLDGHVIKGWPVMTILRGKVIARWPDGAPRPEVVGSPTGRYLPRTLAAAREAEARRQ
jgi:dihydropyrimidinase